LQFTYILESMRFHHWIENILLFAGRIFSSNLLDIVLLAKVPIGPTLFGLAASSIYALNDIQDKEKDKQHPEKCKRPLASRNPRTTNACVTVIFLLVVSLTGVYFLNAVF
jgi:decaprenyl-phosphate phosphoribosyltransferase